MTLGRVCQRWDAQGKTPVGGSPNTEKFPSSGSQGHIRASKVVNRGLGQHGIVLQLRLPQRRAVPGNQHKLGYRSRLVSSRDLLSLTLQSPWKEVGKVRTFAVPHLLQGGLVPERVLSRFDDESETGGDGLGGFGGFRFFSGGHGGRILFCFSRIEVVVGETLTDLFVDRCG